jgi:hypothetical protein
MDTVTIVLIDNGDTEPEVWVFEDSERAQKFADVRGSVMEVLENIEPMSDADADRLIANEIKERRDEERCRQAGL